MAQDGSSSHDTCKAAAQDSSFPWTCFNAPSVGSTTYSNNSYPLLLDRSERYRTTANLATATHYMDDGASAALCAKFKCKSCNCATHGEVIELTADCMASYPTIGNTPNLEVEPQSKKLCGSNLLKAAEEGNPEKRLGTQHLN